METNKVLYKWNYSHKSYLGDTYIFYIENGDSLQYSIDNNHINNISIYFQDKNIYRAIDSTRELDWINTIYESCGDINIIRGAITYRYKELLSNKDNKYFTKMSSGESVRTNY